MKSSHPGPNKALHSPVLMLTTITRQIAVKRGQNEDCFLICHMEGESETQYVVVSGPCLYHPLLAGTVPDSCPRHVHVLHNSIVVQMLEEVNSQRV